MGVGGDRVRQINISDVVRDATFQIGEQSQQALDVVLVPELYKLENLQLAEACPLMTHQSQQSQVMFVSEYVAARILPLSVVLIELEEAEDEVVELDRDIGGRHYHR